jgi:hypothetical protein
MLVVPRYSPWWCSVLIASRRGELAQDLPTAGLALVSLVLLWRFRDNLAWRIAGGAAIGLLLQRG